MDLQRHETTTQKQKKLYAKVKWYRSNTNISKLEDIQCQIQKCFRMEYRAYVEDIICPIVSVPDNQGHMDKNTVNVPGLSSNRIIKTQLALLPYEIQKLADWKSKPHKRHTFYTNNSSPSSVPELLLSSRHSVQTKHSLDMTPCRSLTSLPMDG